MPVVNGVAIALNINIRCIEISLNRSLILDIRPLNINIRCIEIL